MAEKTTTDFGARITTGDRSPMSGGRKIRRRQKTGTATRRPLMFSHGRPLSADAREPSIWLRWQAMSCTAVGQTSAAGR